jgi:hypothetical protein
MQIVFKFNANVSVDRLPSDSLLRYYCEDHQLKTYITNFDTLCEQEWFKTWPMLDYVLKEL